MMTLGKKSIWTNNSLWQDQDTGKTTEEGIMRLKSKGQLSLMEENMASKFAKKETSEKAAPTEKVSKAVKPAKVEKAEKPVKAKKAEKPAKAKKADKAEKSEDTRKITVLVKENPKREGTESHKRFGLYAKSKTVADFIKAGGTMADIKHDEGKSFIKVA